MTKLNIKDTEKNISPNYENSLTTEILKRATASPENFKTFVKQFFTSLSEEYINKADMLFYVAKDFFQFITSRADKSSKIEIYNPTFKENGWQSGFTVIKLLNSDMPFLVDSFTEELKRNGITIYYRINAVLGISRDKKGELIKIYDINEVKNEGKNNQGSEANGTNELFNEGNKKNKNKVADKSLAEPESLIYFAINKISLETIELIKENLQYVFQLIHAAVTDWPKMIKVVDESIRSLNSINTDKVNANSNIDINNDINISSNIDKDNSIVALIDPIENRQEIKTFLQWLKDNNYIFLGCADYSWEKDGSQVENSSLLGINRIASMLEESTIFQDYRGCVYITRSDNLSKVHRGINMDCIRLKLFDNKGTAVGERRFLGLFTSTVYYQDARLIPIIRKKIEIVEKMSRFARGGHNNKALITIIQDFPRAELFHISEEDLYKTCLGMLSLAIKPRLKLFIYTDKVGLFVRIIIFIPNQQFSMNLWARMQKVAAAAFNGKVLNEYIVIGESGLVRLQVILKVSCLEDIIAEEYLENRLALMARNWDTQLKDVLFSRLEENKEAQYLYDNYAEAFPESYKEVFDPAIAFFDILKIEKVEANKNIDVDLYVFGDNYHLKIYVPRNILQLFNLLPVIENMAMKIVDHHSYRIKKEVQQSPEANTWVHHFVLSPIEKIVFQLEKIKEQFETALTLALNHEIENDYYNSLIILAGLNWREVLLIRAFGNYLKQVKFDYSQEYIQTSLSQHPEAAALIVKLFHARFAEANYDAKNNNVLNNGSSNNSDSADNNRDSNNNKIVALSAKKLEVENSLGTKDVAASLETVLEGSLEDNYRKDFLKTKQEKVDIIKHRLEEILTNITNLVDDKIIRIFIELSFAILRTNYYLGRPYISLKINSQEISIMPLPKPFVEIYVYSCAFEAIHLRGGKVARGGIRWSDRSEDFRTEVLGLMKAQMTKNSVIIPVGSKGGFIIKVNIQDKRELQLKTVECYKDFLRGLLDITDNIIDSKVVGPKDIICYDENDTYLVVAADKGTATFSNYANEVSKEYNFWLADAFASGGTSGYDHKKLAITSRGAWVSMRLRLWEVFNDINKAPMTFIGIGDMAGDLFGNGLLLSEQIKLIAAFNHIHIFVDPEPDIAKSYAERKRLFEMPSSTWMDYNKEIISAGGGVFNRSSKSIIITNEIKKALDITENILTPNELIKYILKANVDILWNGGIGTYVKATIEPNENVGDKANDPVRINGKDLRAKIVVEGGNLGCTQLGRIEYSKKKYGCINTDFIDNCGGVCCSDMEVNIKIAFSANILHKKFTFKQRDKLLLEMQGEVCELILEKTNQMQAKLLMLESMNAKNHLEQYQLLLNKLEKTVLLDRGVEFLPTNEEIAKMFAEGTSFERPQIAVLIAYTKMQLYKEIIDSDLPDNTFLNYYLMKYFPSIMREKYREEILKHPLRREIIATHITNNIINNVGCTFVNNAVENTGFSTSEVVCVLITIYEVYRLNELLEEEKSLIGKVDVNIFAEVHLEAYKFLNQTVYWFLRNYPQPVKIGLAVAEFSKDIEDFYHNLTNILNDETLEEYNKLLQKFIDKNISGSLAKKVASLRFLSSGLAIIQTTNRLRFYSKMQVTSLTIGKLYFEVGSILYIPWIREIVNEKLELGSYWQRLSSKTLSDELHDQQMIITAEVAKHLDDKEDYFKALKLWKENNKNKLKNYEEFFNNIRADGNFDISRLVMVMKRLSSIIVK